MKKRVASSVSNSSPGRSPSAAIASLSRLSAAGSRPARAVTSARNALRSAFVTGSAVAAMPGRQVLAGRRVAERGLGRAEVVQHVGEVGLWRRLGKGAAQVRRRARRSSGPDRCRGRRAQDRHGGGVAGRIAAQQMRRDVPGVRTRGREQVGCARVPPPLLVRAEIAQDGGFEDRVPELQRQRRGQEPGRGERVSGGGGIVERQVGEFGAVRQAVSGAEHRARAGERQRAGRQRAHAQ